MQRRWEGQIYRVRILLYLFTKTLSNKPVSKTLDGTIKAIKNMNKCHLENLKLPLLYQKSWLVDASLGRYSWGHMASVHYLLALLRP